jgi:hypothetical protein
MVSSGLLRRVAALHSPSRFSASGFPDGILTQNRKFRGAKECSIPVPFVLSDSYNMLLLLLLPSLRRPWYSLHVAFLHCFVVLSASVV